MIRCTILGLVVCLLFPSAYAAAQTNSEPPKAAEIRVSVQCGAEVPYVRVAGLIGELQESGIESIAISVGDAAEINVTVELPGKVSIKEMQALLDALDKQGLTEIDVTSAHGDSTDGQPLDNGDGASDEKSSDQSQRKTDTHLSL